MLINSHTNAQGQLQHCLTVPRMAVATALMELPPDMRSMFSRLDGGVLLGAHRFQATLTLPMPECPKGMPDSLCSKPMLVMGRSKSLVTNGFVLSLQHAGRDCLDVVMSHAS